MEVKPVLSQLVSVATIKALKDLKLFDISSIDTLNITDENKKEIVDVFASLNYRFSKPNFGDKYDYLPTQYISDLLKEIGFDGIRFNSSLNKTGKNGVIFNNQSNFKAVKSRLYTVNNINIEYENFIDLYKKALDKIKKVLDSLKK